MNRTCLVLTIILLGSVSLLGCGIARNAKSLAHRAKESVMDKMYGRIHVEYMNLHESARPIAQDILDCLQEKDSQKLFAMFCPSAVSENPHSEKDVETLTRSLHVDSHEILKVANIESGKFGRL